MSRGLLALAYSKTKKLTAVDVLVILLLPVAVFVIDDYASNWHGYGHERTIAIVCENFGEDLAALIFYFSIRWWESRPIRHFRAQCPDCHFRWLMHPKQKIPFCPRCGAPEPP